MKSYNLNVDWRKYIRVDNQQFLNYILHNKKEFYINLTDNLIKSHKLNIPFITLFKFNNNIKSIAYLTEYLEILNEIKKVCEKIEMYEVCGIILDYLNKHKLKTDRLNASKQYRKETSQR